MPPSELVKRRLVSGSPGPFLTQHGDPQEIAGNEGGFCQVIPIKGSRELLLRFSCDPLSQAVLLP